MHEPGINGTQIIEPPAVTVDATSGRLDRLMRIHSAKRPATLAACLALACCYVTAPSFAQAPHLNFTQPGGMPGLPVVTGIAANSNSVTVTWDGPAGYYRLMRSLSLAGTQWTPVATNHNRNATLALQLASNAFFRVQGPAPQYAGAFACAECHEGIHNSEMNTRHAGALQTLKAAGQGNNKSCLPCHTVGYGLPTGFTTEAATPYLAGVQCENCHGPAALHAANPYDLAVRPRIEIAGQLCGGCHTVSNHPTYDEWSGSKHFAVVGDMNPSGRINSCGRCHSGSARLALIEGEDPVVTVTGDANVGITCVVCHDPHATNANPAQLRYPVASTNDYFLTTSDVFTNKYNPNINICAQCHNHRGASWTGNSRPPHHSPQYNFLLGTVGEVNNPAERYTAGHARLQKQCVTCHMQTEEYVSEAQPAVTGHSFEVESFDACVQCHPFPELLTQFTMGSIGARIQDVKNTLDLWATTKAPEPLRTKYGALAWEYTNVGGLSTGSPGPSSTEQGTIPANIRKARYNLYLVYHDGSFGVHNGPYAVTLLENAKSWVEEELAK